MKKSQMISALLSISGVCMIVIALIIMGFTNENSFIAYSSNNEIVTASMKYTSPGTIKEVSMPSSPKATLNIAKASQGDILSGQTVEEIAINLNKHLGTDLLMNKGDLIAGYCISIGVDPYLATAVMLHETGCKSKCSALVRKCNNVAGQKGAPSCNGSYKGYSTIDEGIKGAINNLHKNYYSRGLTTVELIGPRYAESSSWVSKINSYINMLKG